MPQTIDEIALVISSAPVPVIYLDTCSILDVIRIVQRDRLPSTIIRSAMDLCARARATPRTCHIVATELVLAEWADNVDGVIDEALAAIAKANAFQARARVVAGAMSLPAYAPGLDVDRQLVHRLRQVGEDVLAAALIIEADSNCKIQATDRVIRCLAPASKGKQELKDCFIVEHYLALARKISGIGVRQVLVSSNTKDYCGAAAHTSLAPPLDTEFAGAGLRWAGDLAWAQAICDGRA